MRNKIGLLFVIIVISTAANATAGYHPFFWKNQQSRQQEARMWLAEYRKLNAQIPTLSPAEQRWLKTEYDDEISRNGGHFTKRALDAGASKEFALRSTKPHIETIIGILSELAGPNGTGDAKAIMDNIVIAYFNGELDK